MKSIKSILSICIVTLVLLSCNNDPSLQKYYVDNQENQNFMVVDIPTSILNIKIDSLTDKQQKAFKSIDKLNFLGFKKTEDNITIYQTEKEKVAHILSNHTYKTLIKYGGKNQGAVVKYLGNDNAIDEVVIFGSNNTQGFGIIRVIGDDMNPSQVLDLIEVVKKSKPNKDSFKDIASFF